MSFDPLEQKIGDSPATPPPAPVPVFLVTNEERRREEPAMPDAPDGPFWAPHEDESVVDAAADDETAHLVAPAPALPLPAPKAPKTAWLKIVIGIALLIWMGVALKVWQLRNRPAPVATVPAPTQAHGTPRATAAPTRPVVRRPAPVKRRVVNTIRRLKQAPRRAAEPARSIILGRGAVAEDDKSIIRIRD